MRRPSSDSQKSRPFCSELSGASCSKGYKSDVSAVSALTSERERSVSKSSERGCEQLGSVKEGDDELHVQEIAKTLLELRQSTSERLTTAEQKLRAEHQAVLEDLSRQVNSLLRRIGCHESQQRLAEPQQILMQHAISDGTGGSGSLPNVLSAVKPAEGAVPSKRWMNAPVARVVSPPAPSSPPPPGLHSKNGAAGASGSGGWTSAQSRPSCLRPTVTYMAAGKGGPRQTSPAVDDCMSDEGSTRGKPAVVEKGKKFPVSPGKPTAESLLAARKSIAACAAAGNPLAGMLNTGALLGSEGKPTARRPSIAQQLNAHRIQLQMMQAHDESRCMSKASSSDSSSALTDSSSSSSDEDDEDGAKFSSSAEGGEAKPQAASRRASHKEGQLEMLDVWKKDAKEYAKMRRQWKQTQKGVGYLKQLSFSVGASTDLLEKKKQEPIKRVPFHPYFKVRGSWDVVSLILISWDMVMLPMGTFDLPKSILRDVMDWATRIFWTLDIVASFATGFLLPNGHIEMGRREVAIHYFKTWFVPDVLLVLLDWVEVTMSGATGDSSASGSGGQSLAASRIGKVSRMFRAMRVLRLVRLARLKGIINAMTFRLRSEKLVITADICKILLTVIATAHVMACMWWGIGDSPEKGTWAQKDGIQDYGLALQYLLALHWAIAQFNGGMDEFRAGTFEERLYNVIAFLFAFMAASVCISGLTSSMTRLHILSSQQSRQLSVLRRYLIQTGVSDELSLRVQRNALHASVEQERLMDEESVELLNLVSEPLRKELHFEMYSPVLEVHPFFLEYTSKAPRAVSKICHSACSALLVSSGDVIFAYGEAQDAPHMYITCTGSYEYVNDKGENTTLPPGKWLAEAGLWTKWVHRGTFAATSDGRLCCLEAEVFQNIASKSITPEVDPKQYAEEYLDLLNRMMNDGDEVNDMATGFENTIGFEHDWGEPKEKQEVNKPMMRRTQGETMKILTNVTSAWRSGKRASVLFSSKDDTKKVSNGFVFPTVHESGQGSP
eukprot:TRINITY_DN20193_c0_g1_i1.p1 TRINITY_DN20193_c0_g1~~TRINITY_DN20193_c0_g1_i1.p1  ORF type:complete len:1007 (+),score=246.49 TRINITY_DN20193_c0_g1_i1:164-3184(+)